VIVLVVNLIRIASRETKRDAPVGLYGYWPSAFASAFEFVQAQRRDAQVVDGSGLLQLGQNQADSIGVLRLNAGFGAREEKLLQPLVRKALDHEPIVT
jgi:hypothetical protein